MVRLCLNQYADRLLPDEMDTLEQLLSLDLPAQTLLIRIVMRKGRLFRIDALQYSEMPDRNKAIDTLVRSELVGGGNPGSPWINPAI